VVLSVNSLGYCSFATKKTRAQVSRIFPRAYLEVARGTPTEASAYCKKEGNFQEWGLLPMTGGESTALNWELIKKAAVEGNLDDIPAKEYIAHYGTLKRIEVDNKPIPEDLVWEDNCAPNEWIYGPTGTGKSHFARNTYKGCYLKMNNKWWDQYKDEEVVLIEDVGMTHLWMGDFLKIWGDRYGFRAEVKHLTNVMRPKKIVVTSNYHPSELWADKNVVDPILRRFKLIEKKDFYVPPAKPAVPIPAPQSPNLIEDSEEEDQIVLVQPADEADEVFAEHSQFSDDERDKCNQK